jgi:hypothetical protein
MDVWLVWELDNEARRYLMGIFDSEVKADAHVASLSWRESFGYTVTKESVL